MLRLLSFLARVAFAATLGLVVLAVSRWSPVAAQAPLDVRALPLSLPLVGFAVAAALLGRPRRPRRLAPVAVALLLSVCALALWVKGRGPAGLAAELSDGAEAIGRTLPGSVEITGRDLAAFPLGRHVALHWTGELRVPASGRHELWVEGRGHVALSVDGRLVIDATGDPLRGATAIGLAKGAVPLDVRFDHTGAGPRLRLGWTRPDGRRETIPARYLGAPRPAWVWWTTDGLALLVAVLAGMLVFLLPWDARRDVPLPRPVTAAEIAASVLGYGVLLAVMSWPLVRDLAHAGPMDRPDGRLNAWILAWAGPTLFENPAGLFDAPAFHPLPDALAFSENLLLPAVVVAPLQRTFGPVLAYNVALLGSLLLSGLAAQLLVRRASGDRLAAFVAGAFFAAGPHRWTRLSHLHAQVTLFLPLALLALDRFWESRTLRRALVVGLMLALQGLSSVYLGAITATALGTAVLVALFGGLRPRELGRLAAGLLLAGVLLWPVTEPYLRMRAFQGQEFGLETVAIYAATLPSYVAAGTQAWGPLTQRLLDPTTIRDTLFPGLCVLALGIAGLASAPRRYRAVAVVASAVAVLFSLGPETAFYRFLHEHLVLVRGVRALARFALVPTLALSVLAGLALAGRRRLVVLAALALMLLESANLPLRLERYDGPSEASRWLAGKPGAVLVLPLAENDTLAMLDGLAHRRPLVNGDSGFIPRPFDRALELLEHGLDAGGASLPARGGRAPRDRTERRPCRGPAVRRARGRQIRARAGARAGAGSGRLRRPAGRGRSHALVVDRCRPDAARATPGRACRLRAVGRAVGRAPGRRGLARRLDLGAGRGRRPASPTPRCRSTAIRSADAARSASLRARCGSCAWTRASPRAGAPWKWGSSRSGRADRGSARVDCQSAIFHAPPCFT